MNDTESGFCEVAGGRIYFEVEGRGEPVLFIHAGVANLRMWDQQAAGLGDRFRVLRFDTRGYGRSESEHVEFSNRADAAAVLDVVGEATAHIVGSSRGGHIALDFALEYPTRSRSLTVVAGGVGGYESSAPSTVDWDEVEAWEEAGDWDRLTQFETEYWVDGPGQPRDRVAPQTRSMVMEWIASSYRANKDEAIPQPLDPPAEERLDELRIPLLVMLGELDDPGTNDAMRHLATRVPGARLETFPTAHMVNLEQPERFNALLGEFLDSARGSTPQTG